MTDTTFIKLVVLLLLWGVVVQISRGRISFPQDIAVIISSVATLYFVLDILFHFGILKIFHH